VVGQGLGAVDMVDQRTSKAGIAAIAAGLGCWAEEALTQVVIHPSGVGEHREDCSAPRRGRAQAPTGIEIVLDGIAAAVVAAAAEAYNFGSQAVVVGGRTESEASVDVAGRAFGRQKPYLGCRVLAEYSTTSFVSSFA
jgi:hypothetical protein